MDKKKSNSFATALTLMIVAEKIAKGKAKDADLKKMSSSMADKLSTINDAVKLVGKVKGFLK